MHKNYNTQLINILLVFLILSYMLDPTGELFNLKYLSTGLIFLIATINCVIKYKKVNLNKLQLSYITLFCIIMPIYGSAITFIHSNFKSFLDSSYIGFSVLLILLLPILFLENIKYIQALIISLRVLTILIIIILLSFIYDGDQLGISNFFIEHKSMFVGFREYGGISTYYLYFTASPLLLILISYDSYMLLYKKRVKHFLLFLLSVFALFLTGTRFNMLISILILPSILFISNFKMKHLLIYTFILITSTFIIFQNSFTSSFFDSKEESNSVKTGYFNDYISILSKPDMLLFGQGYNAQEWSMNFKNMLIRSYNEGSKTELSYLELVRVYGLIVGTILIISLFIIPLLVYKKYKKINYIIFAIFIYLINSALNPYLFSTNGVLFTLFFLIELENKPLLFNDKKEFIYA